MDSRQDKTTAVVTFAENIESTLRLARDCNIHFATKTTDSCNGIFKFDVSVEDRRKKGNSNLKSVTSYHS